ncbi:hypothetical protein SKAU_G00001210 [Synaphobranchus kaupii]|uniref:Uncharacterized protein n=1 Tax=Synaphobranchus kaupii TaxID=118154 RepID=A0A9Q1G958_SYNKA|nr:hypothetical protein SKAU_G00001210 [Synaphobranchus kaupii]
MFLTQGRALMKAVCEKSTAARSAGLRRRAHRPSPPRCFRALACTRVLAGPELGSHRAERRRDGRAEECLRGSALEGLDR